MISSKVKVTAAIGVLKAAAIPAATPTGVMRRWLRRERDESRDQTGHARANLDGRPFTAQRAPTTDLHDTKNELADCVPQGDGPAYRA